MEILKILEESGKSLYPEDLDFFETELATGDGYSDSYRKQCKDLISELRVWLTSEPIDKTAVKATPQNDTLPTGLLVGIQNLAPNENNPTAASLTPEQLIFGDITAMREVSSYKTNFKKYVDEKTEINAAFVDAHYSFFQPWELDAIISVKQMGEDFIEKYFGALDHDKIARYQQFSEAFFMKHFSQMDYTIVLEHSKNEWRKKENRSRQLDVFLRLKGIKN